MTIRKYMVIGVLSIVVFPWIVYFLISLIASHSWATPSGTGQAELTRTVQMIVQNERNWRSMDWQERVTSELRREGIAVKINSPSNQVIFDSSPQTLHGHPHWTSMDEVAVMDNGKWVATVLVSEPGKPDPVAAVGAILATILAIAFVSFQVGRNVIKPLESMSRAALQIADGDLDFELASSTTVEIKRVRTAFEVMGKGLRDAFANQQKLEEERKFFIGAIAHDLRTPLFALRGFLDGMEQGIASTPEKLAHYVAVCKEKAAHLERLVSDLFAFTRLEYMEQTLQRERFDLYEVLHMTVDSMVGRAQEKEIAMETSPTEEECFISGDPHLLERAITNLLDNALTHTPIKGKITIRLQRDSENVVLTMEDTGPGFSPEDVNHIFDPMYRGDTSRNASTGGAGLGLTIARRIFRSHGGDLWAENSPRGGALLTACIPDNVTRHESL